MVVVESMAVPLEFEVSQCRKAVAALQAVKVVRVMVKRFTPIHRDAAKG